MRGVIRRNLSRGLKGLESLSLSQASQKIQLRLYTAPLNDMQFLIQDVFKFQARYSELGYDAETCKWETISSIISETANFAQTEIAPLSSISDSEGCKYFGPHDVKSPPGFKEAYEKYRNGDWVGLSFPKKYGGQELPNSIAIFHGEILGTACQPWSSYTGLSKGAAKTLMTHGSQEVRDLFVRRLVTGEWMGTMCLTEPQCGSDLSQVMCRADKLEDGRYHINGTKIFISCGDHDITPNIVHLVLARIPGGPIGTHGLSLFAVPKHLISENNEPDSKYNGVNIGRIEEKMGYHGTPTCEINFENAVGYLVGQPHKGLHHMFTFMNNARIGSAFMGVNAAEKSYQNALSYAKSRRAFRAAKGSIDSDHAADPIIVHPDIRKMLLTQKAIAEGGRAMLYSCALINDQLLKHMEIDDTANIDLLDAQLSFMTPIVKGFLTERGIEAASLGIQIYGGHGYIKGNRQEQILRDARISSIWEGTTGIQSLDLLRRKIFGNGLNDLTVINSHCTALQEYCKDVRKRAQAPNLQRHAEMLFIKANEWMELTRRISIEIQKDPNALGSASVDYLMYSGYITLAEHWLIMEDCATKVMEIKEPTQSKEFYETKIRMADFVFANLLPRVEAHKLSALAQANTVMEIPPDNFSFDY